MTIDELIELIRDVGEWKRTAYDHIRCKPIGMEYELCPLNAAYYKRTGVILQDEEYKQTLKLLQLDETTGNDIADAADGNFKYSAVDYREKLLTLCANPVPNGSNS